MQQNGSSGSNGSEGPARPDGPESPAGPRQPRPFSPLPAASTRVRRFLQDRRTLPLPRVMVVFSADKPGDAASGTDPAEDGVRRTEPATPSLALSKPLDPAQLQEVGPERTGPGTLKLR